MHGSEGREEERGAGERRKKEKGKLPSLAAGKRQLVEVCSQQLTSIFMPSTVISTEPFSMTSPGFTCT